ncbi:MAG: MoaD/ThiS family protein [Thermoplasmata archaeon]|nr:MoaD/ThiS family protein [Thermoplasmata archaeon]
MKVRIKYLMTFSQMAGKRNEEVEVPEGSTLKDLVSLLKKDKGRDFGRYLDESLKNNTVAFLVNKSAVGDDVKLKSGDEVIVSHIVGGG